MRTTSTELLPVRRLIEAVIDEDVPAIDALLTPLNLPEHDPLTGVVLMTAGDEAAGRLMGVQCLAGYARARGDVRMAADITLALVETFEALKYFDSPLPEATTLMVANVVDVCANTLPDAGYVPELLRRAPRWVAWLDRPSLAAQWR